MLTLLKVKIVTAATTLLPILISVSVFEHEYLMDEDSTLASSACELDDVQAAMIRSAMLARNATCSCNMTLDAILEGGPW